MNDMLTPSTGTVKEASISVVLDFESLRAKMSADGIDMSSDVAIRVGGFTRFSTDPAKRSDTAGWVKIFADGKGATYGDFRSNTTGSWCSYLRVPNDVKQLHAAEGKVAIALRDAASAKYDAEHTAEAAALWASATDCVDHEYLTAKAVPALGGVRRSKGMLLIPGYDSYGNLRSLERIFYVDTDGKRERIRRHVGPKKGSHLVLGTLGDFAIFVEGYADGATIHGATGHPVVVCFSANIGNVVKDILTAHPGLKIMIAGDDDWAATENIGRKAAESAGRLADGFVVFPVFPGIRAATDTDFNALALKVSPDAVRKQINDAVDKMHELSSPAHQAFLAMGVIPLGIKGGNPVIAKEMRSKGRVSTEILFVKNRKEALSTLGSMSALADIAITDKGKPDYDAIYDHLRASCESQGVYFVTDERGAGLWLDQNKQPKLHTGDRCYKDGDTYYMPDYYGFRLPAKVYDPVKMREMASEWHAAIALMAGDYMASMLVGWSVAAFMGGALPWRPHIWVIAPSDSGKSYIRVSVEKVMGKAARSNDGCFGTSAGIRGIVQNSACSVIIDETESSNSNGDSLVKEFVELARSAAQGTKAHKATAAMDSRQFQLMSPMYMSSIESVELKDADRTRILELEFEPIGAKPSDMLKDFEKLNALGAQILAGIVGEWPQLQAALAEGHGEVEKHGGKWRMQNTVGALLGLAKWVTGKTDIQMPYGMLKERYIPQDTNNLVSTILDLPINQTYTVGHIIAELMNGSLEKDSTDGKAAIREMETKVGVTIMAPAFTKKPDEFVLGIPITSPTLAKALSGGRSSTSDWNSKLKAFPGAEAGKSISFSSVKGCKGVRIKLTSLKDIDPPF